MNRASIWTEVLKTYQDFQSYSDIGTVEAVPPIGTNPTATEFKTFLFDRKDSASNGGVGTHTSESHNRPRRMSFCLMATNLYDQVVINQGLSQKLFTAF